MVKEKMIYSRVTKDEFRQAQEALKRERSSLSEYLRELLRNDLRGKGLWPPTGAAPAGERAKC
jgi:hypothetical protein